MIINIVMIVWIGCVISVCRLYLMKLIIKIMISFFEVVVKINGCVLIFDKLVIIFIVVDGVNGK